MYRWLERDDNHHIIIFTLANHDQHDWIIIIITKSINIEHVHHNTKILSKFNPVNKLFF